MGKQMLESKQMKTEDWIKHLLLALESLDGLPVNERIRITLRRACSEAIVEAEDNMLRLYESRNSGNKWSTPHLDLLKECLSNAKKCDSWEQERVVLKELVYKLGRPEKIIKAKAIELGYANKVDYWLNK